MNYCKYFVIILFSCQLRYAYSQNLTLGKPKTRIFGGKYVEMYERPYQVSIRYNGEHICGGSLLNERLVITAAHCMFYITDISFEKWKPVPASKLTVFAGDVDLHGSRGELRKVSKIYVYPHYLARSNAFSHDIAIIKMEYAFEFSNDIGPIKIRKDSISDYKNITCKVSGWGKTNKNVLSSRLMKIEVPIYDYKYCKEIYRWKLGRNMICAGIKNGGLDACQGDSGGPLVCRDLLTGIVSFGKICREQSVHIGVYTEVYKYQSWITKITEKDSANYFYSKSAQHFGFHLGYLVVLYLNILL